MKIYGKLASFVLFLGLGAFVLFQYQNCGNSSSTNNSSAVGPAGISYTVVFSPTNPATHGVPDPMTVQVNTSGAELLIIKIGTIIGGNRIPYCTIPTQVPITQTQVSCQPTFNQTGPLQLYVELDDPNFGPGQPMLVCASPPVQGCLGTYPITVQ